MSYDLIFNESKPFYKHQKSGFLNIIIYHKVASNWKYCPPLLLIQMRTAFELRITINQKVISKVIELKSQNQNHIESQDSQRLTAPVTIVDKLHREVSGWCFSYTILVNLRSYFSDHNFLFLSLARLSLCIPTMTKTTVCKSLFWFNTTTLYHFNTALNNINVLLHQSVCTMTAGPTDQCDGKFTITKL